MSSILGLRALWRPCSYVVQKVAAKFLELGSLPVKSVPLASWSRDVLSLKFPKGQACEEGDLTVTLVATKL